MKYKVLVADDEYIIRRGIIKLLHKYNELEVIAEAEDGEQALEIASEREIDILFVDINMPFINGLQFIERLREIRPDAMVNIITGYDKFEYVRQALRLGVFEYILKPLNESAFDETIHKIVEALDKKKQEDKYLEWAKVTLGKNKANLIGDFFEKCIAQDYRQEKIKEEMDYLNLNLPIPYTMTLVHLERVENPDLRQHWNDSLLYCTAENIAGELYAKLSPLSYFQSGRDFLILICRVETKSILEAINQEYKKMVEKYIPVNVVLLQQSEQDCYQMPYLYQSLIKRLEEIKSYPTIIKDIKKFITKNYHREDISLLDAAEYVSLSPQHVSRVFKKEVGITFVDYLTQVRIGKAIELFENDNLKMYEIAERVGYSTQHYFSSVFKKVLGISPIEYRNQYKNLKKENIFELSR
jgi:two-component system response regulator YesN